jgi:hypothetical protein
MMRDGNFSFMALRERPLTPPPLRSAHPLPVNGARENGNGAAFPFSPSERGEGAGRRMRGSDVETTVAAAECRDTPLCPAGHLPHKGGDQQASNLGGLH